MRVRREGMDGLGGMEWNREGKSVLVPRSFKSVDKVGNVEIGVTPALTRSLSPRERNVIDISPHQSYDKAFQQ